MRAINKPNFDPNFVYALCVGSINDLELRNRLSGIAKDVALACSTYEALADSGMLYTIPEHKGNNSTEVLGGVTKGELKSVYTQHMVGKDKPARSVYESLLSLSPGKKCPLCGFGHVKTLDHYLPKAKFPLFSVLPINLIPACRDCNTGKLASTSSVANEQSIHPYYDREHFFTDQWLTAKIEQTEPATVLFYVTPPEVWDSLSKNRAEAHFKSYSLSSRYSVEVANQLSELRYELAYMSDEESRRDHLQQRAESCKKVHKNSWQTALHQALANSPWYCDAGFALG